MKHHRDAVSGMTVRIVYALRARNISAIEVLYIPFLFLTVYATYRTSHAAIQESPLYHQMEQLAPLNVWLAVIFVCAVLIFFGALDHELLAMVAGYLVSAVIWLTVAGLIYDLTHTYQTPLVYVFVGIAAIYRTADLWVTRRDLRLARGRVTEDVRR